MQLSVPATVFLPLSVRLLLVVQLATLAVTARGQVLTIPSDDSPRTFEPAQSYGSTGPTEPVATSDSSVDMPDFVMTIRTELIGRFVNQETVRSDNVATQVMEANVTGYQTTTTNVQLRSTDSPQNARLDVLIQGTVSSNTVGLTQQARIATLGSHTFNVTKPVFFDGTTYLTKNAYGSLQARQFPQTVDTVASGLPLIGRIGNRVAWSEIYRRMPMTDAIVVRQVADDVLPEVNRSVDSHLSDLNRTWRTLRRQLESLSGNDGIQWTASSTSDSFSTTARNRSVTQRVAGTKQLPVRLEKGEDFVLLLTQEGVNRSLARLPIAGMTLPDAALQQLLADLKDVQNDPSGLQTILEQPELLTQEPLLFSIKFAEVQPIALQYTDGWVTALLKFQIIPKIGEPGLMQLVKARLRGEAADDGSWEIVLNKLSAEPASSNAQPDLYTNLINSPAIASQIPSTPLPRTIDLRKFHPKMPLFRLHRVQSQNGQLRISVRTIKSP